MSFGFVNSFDFLAEDTQDDLALKYEDGLAAAPQYRAAEKAYFVVLSDMDDSEVPGTEVKCQFNPTDLDLDNIVLMTDAYEPGQGLRRLAFGPGSLKFNLLYDSTEMGVNVQQLFDPLLDFVKAKAADPNQKPGQKPPLPPRIGFRWTGLTRTAPLNGVMIDLKVHYSMFAADGTPLRATVSFSIKLGPPEPPAQDGASAKPEGSGSKDKGGGTPPPGKPSDGGPNSGGDTPGYKNNLPTQNGVPPSAQPAKGAGR